MPDADHPLLLTQLATRNPGSRLQIRINTLLGIGRVSSGSRQREARDLSQAWDENLATLSYPTRMSLVELLPELDLQARRILRRGGTIGYPVAAPLCEPSSLQFLHMRMCK